MAYHCTYEWWVEIIAPPFVDFAANADHFICDGAFVLYPRQTNMSVNIPLRKGISAHQRKPILDGDSEIYFRLRAEFRDAFSPDRYSEFGYSIEGRGSRPLPKCNDSN